MPDLASLLAEPDWVGIQAIDPPGPPALMTLAEGAATYTAEGGWQFTKRPKRWSMTEYIGTDTYTQTINVKFGDAVQMGLPVEETIAILRETMRAPVGLRKQPAVVQIAGAGVWFPWLRWIMQSMSLKDIYRDESGHVYYASATLLLYQWMPTDLIIAQSVSPAQSVAAAGQPGGGGVGGLPGRPGTPAAPASSGGTYTVKQGDTLSGIAAKLLGNAGRWGEIASLNGIRDPRSLKVGQVLRLPAGAGGSSAPARNAAPRTVPRPPPPKPFMVRPGHPQ